MNFAQLRFAIPAAALIGVASVPATAQRPMSPEERMVLLEQRLAASQSAAMRLDQRLSAIERQLQQLINQGEVGGHRIGVLESEIANLRSDVDRRLTALENRPVAVETGASSISEPEPSATRPEARTAAASTPQLPAGGSGSASDPGEETYSEGFRLWRDGHYDQAITALRAFTSAYPNHRRVSFANNLIGRALLDGGKPRPAADALLANYRSNPNGERAPDSLYYLGQALMKLNQPSQACKAYAELEEVYGASVRPDLKALVNAGKAEANCS